MASPLNDRRRQAGSTAALLGLALLAIPPSTALAVEAPAYDNPEADGPPCVVLDAFRATQDRRTGDNLGYRADATLGNTCGRTIELSVCFRYLEAQGDAERTCFGGVVRPYSTATIRTPPYPVRVAGPELQWRYLPVVGSQYPVR